MGFNRRYLKILPLLGVYLLSGCASYQIAGEFEGTGQIFSGNVVVMPMDIGTINIKTADGAVTCSGTSQVTSRPSLYTLIGAQGSATADCSDGRTFKVDFIQTTENGGNGRGIDNQGNIVQLFFNMSGSAARSQLKIKQLDALVQ